MRFRTAATLVFILLLAAFVTLNVEEFVRPSMLRLGFTTVSASLGVVMLLLLAAALLVFLASTLYMRSRNVLEARIHTRELNAQRELADKAEASRFTALRGYLEEQALAAQRREATLENTLAERFAQQHQALLARIEQSDSAMAAYLGQLESRLAGRGPVGRAPDRLPG